MKKDIAEKSLLEQDDVFADIANVNLFNGAQTILPENLQCAPATGYYRSQDGKQRMLFRDVAKQINGLHGTIAFIGFENQSAISNIMPVRVMGYNYTSYMKQVDSFTAENRRNKNSAFSKEIHDWQKLNPVATYILYYGTEKWEKPLFLMDMLDALSKDGRFEEMKQSYNSCDETVKEEGVNMCELFDMVEEDGIKKGLKLGADIFKAVRSGMEDNYEIAKICNCKVEDVESVRSSFGI